MAFFVPKVIPSSGACSFRIIGCMNERMEAVVEKLARVSCIVFINQSQKKETFYHHAVITIPPLITLFP